MSHRSLVRFFQVLTGLLLGLAVLIWFLPGSGPARTEGGEYFLPDPLVAPDFTLTSHEGEAVSLANFTGKVIAVFFGYTSCPDVCPLTLSHLRGALADLREHGERIQVLFISVDPQRDTEDRLREYLESFHPSFLGLRGTVDEVRQVADAYGVFFARSGAEPGYTVDHTARTFVIGEDGRIPLTFPVTASREEMARYLAALLDVDS